MIEFNSFSSEMSVFRSNTICAEYNCMMEPCSCRLDGREMGMKKRSGSRKGCFKHRHLHVIARYVIDLFVLGDDDHDEHTKHKSDNFLDGLLQRRSFKQLGND
jgi:hypothetical protein